MASHRQSGRPAPIGAYANGPTHFGGRRKSGGNRATARRKGSDRRGREDELEDQGKQALEEDSTDSQRLRGQLQPPVQPRLQERQKQGVGDHLKKDFANFKKEVAHQLLDAMDEDSLWRLAEVLQTKGLIRALPNGLMTVAWESACSRPEPAAESGRMSPVPVDEGVPVPSMACAPRRQDLPCPVKLQRAAVVAAEEKEALHRELSEPAPSTGMSQNVARQEAAPAKEELVLSLQLLLQHRQQQLQQQQQQQQQQQWHTEMHEQSGPSAAPPAATSSSVVPSSREEQSPVESRVTTLILRNLPPDFSQQAAQDWIDGKGCEGQYDFLLWFPAKKTSRLSTSSYAFVNFRDMRHAQQFQTNFHLTRFPPSEACPTKQQLPLSIAIAKVQGFVENYVRFHHLVDERSPTVCQPYFAPDAVSALSEEAQQAAAAEAAKFPRPENQQNGPHTTLIIRNLPLSMESNESARHWLDQLGFADQYDFFLYFPPKRRCVEASNGQGVPPQGLGYAFVNFKATETFTQCSELLNGRSLASGDPVLNVVAARVQGLEECQSHFSCLNGRVALWTEPSAATLMRYQ